CSMATSTTSWQQRLPSAPLARRQAQSRTWNRSARAQPHAGTQKFLRIDGFAVDPGFVVEVRSGRASGRSDRSDHLADPDGIADLDVDLGKMAVAGGQAVAVIDLHHSSIAAGPAGGNDFSVGGGAHGIAGCRAKVETGVHGRTAKEGIAADPK